MSLEETSNHVNSQDLQWTAVTAVILLKFSCWPRRLLHPLSQHHCRSSNQGRTCPPDQRRWWWTGTPWSNWVNLHQVSLGICAFRHLHNNDNAHSFSLRSSARELQGHCRGIVPALQGHCKEYRRANKGQHLPSWQAQVPCSSRLQPWHQTKPETSCCSWQGEWLRVQCQGIGASNGCGEPEPFVRGSIQPRPLLLNSQVVLFLILNRLNLSAFSYICKRISRRFLWSKGHPHLISVDLT